MRSALLLLAISLFGCASSPVEPRQGPTARSLMLTPDSTTVDTAGILQFEAKAVWSDGADRPAEVTYSASGGEISAAGLFRSGRTPGQFLVVATCTCGVSDSALIRVTVPPHAVGLTLLPSAATLDTGATVGFLPAVTWSDSADHLALLSYSATGGTISSVGIYSAGSTAGQFQVIAACDCGVADTATVTISVNATPPSFTGLTLGITGLPASAQAQVSISGPGGFARNATVSAAYDSLSPGVYEVRASGVTSGNNSYTPIEPAQSITLTAGVIGIAQVSYRLLASDGLPPHPRVWMTPARVAHIQAQAAAGAQRWTRVKSAADGQVAKGLAYTGGDVNILPDLCLSYLGTRDPKYAARAGVILSNFAVETNDLKYDSGYGYRFILPLVTEGLDWCYDGLTVAQRQQAATWLMNRADWVWPQTNPSRASGYGTNDPNNNYWWGFMMSGPAAIAASGDDTGTGLVSGTDRARYHLQLAITKWGQQARPVLEGASAGGAWSEGTGYDNTARVGSFAEALMLAGTPVASPFFRESLLWRFASTMPGGRYKAPLGDQPRVSDAPTYTYDRPAALYVLSPALADESLKGQAQYWLNLIGQPPTSEFNETGILADELLRYDPRQPAAADLRGLAKWHYAPGAGFFIYRQDWTDPNTTVMVFESGPTSDHGSRDANGLMIWKGSFWISANANIYSHSGIEGQTQNFNNLTVGTFGQVLYPSNGGSFTTPPQVSDALVVVRGQAKNGYGYPSGVGYGRTVVSDYLRTVAYLPQQDIFVIVDRASVFNSTLPKVWRWHMKDPPQVSGNTFRLQAPSGDFRCFGSVLAPSDVALGTESFALGTSPGVSSNAVTVSMSGRTRDVVVTVLQCTNAQSAPFLATATVNAAEVAVMVGGRRVVFPLDEFQPVRLE